MRRADDLGDATMARVNRTTGLFLVLGVVILLGTVAGTAWMQQGGEPQQVARSSESAVYASGNVDVESGLAVLVPRGIAGRVSAIHVKEGNVVKKDQPLVQLDDQYQRKQLKIAEQALEASRAHLKDAKDLADKKVKEYELDLERAKGVLNTADIQYRSAFDDYQRAKKYEKEGTDAGAKAMAEKLLRAAELAHAQLTAAGNVLEKLKSINPRVSLSEP